MRNRWRVTAFDVLAPAGAVVALVYIGIALAWPLWWVSVCSVLCLLIVEGVVVNIVLARRDSVTGKDPSDQVGFAHPWGGLECNACTSHVLLVRCVRHEKGSVKS